MKKVVLAIVFLSVVISCKKEIVVDTNVSFDTFKEHYVLELWKMYPDWASGAGFHNYDSILVVPDAKYKASQITFSKAYLDSLKHYPIDKLSDHNKTDYYLIQNQLESSLFSINELKSFEWNPSNYNVSGSFAEILNGSYDSLDNRLRNLNLKLKTVPAYYAAAKEQIKNPTLEHTSLAIEQNLGGVSVFESDLQEAIAKSGLSASEKDEMKTKSLKAVEAIKDYVSWLQAMKHEQPRSFRLGSDLYAKKFDLDIQSGYSSEEIYAIALDQKAALHQKMYILAEKLWPKYFPTAPKPAEKLDLIKQVIDKISLQHTTPENFQSEIEKQIPELITFVKAKDLVYIDPSKPLVVRKEPDYMAGVAGASISAPGPYDENGNTYYNVGSMNGWSKEQSESYLREYNDYILQILNIHEAIPGHYTQLVYSNQSPSIIKAILGNGAMIEGWAVYTERMMLENGYKDSDEMWLMYYKWNLRTICNTILDNSVHTKNMTKETALDLLTKEAFQQKAEAEGKWKRVTLTQVQLCSYFTGFTEIYDFREHLKAKEGNAFNLKKFHEKFLSYGSAPVKYIKDLYEGKKKEKANTK